MGPTITSESELRDANSEVRCCGCDKVLWDQTGVRTPQFVVRIMGVSRPAGEIRLPDESSMTVTEHPSICASPACLDRVMSDPTWHHKSLDAWAVERERLMDQYSTEAFPPLSPEEVKEQEEKSRQLDFLLERERVVRKTLYELGKRGPVREADQTYLAAVCEAVRELASIEDGLVEIMGSKVPVLCQHQR